MSKAVKILTIRRQSKPIAVCPSPGCGQEYELELDPGVSEEAARRYTEDELLADHKRKEPYHPFSLDIPTQRIA